MFFFPIFFAILAVFVISRIRSIAGYFFPRFIYFNHRYDLPFGIFSSMQTRSSRFGNVDKYSKLSVTNFSPYSGIASGYLFNGNFAISSVSVFSFAKYRLYRCHFFKYPPNVMAFIFYAISSHDNRLVFSYPIRVSPISSSFNPKFNDMIFVVNSKFFIK